MDHIARKSRWLYGTAGALAFMALLGACGAPAEEGDALGTDDIEVGEASEAATVVATYGVNGQTLTVSNVASISLTTSRIASCADGVLYSTRTDGTLWVNLTDGEGGWTEVTGGAKGTRIACDRTHLYSLDGNGQLWHAYVRSNGKLSTKDWGGNAIAYWTSTGYSVPAGTTEINSGLGNIYALKEAAGGGTLWSSALPDRNNNDFKQGKTGSWIQHASNLGSKFVTGAGSLALRTQAPYPSSRMENRAYGMNPDGTLFYNDLVLDGGNSWSSFPNAGKVASAITADRPNLMYAVVNSDGGQIITKRLYKYEFKESNCTDGQDNDANGMMDAEDPACQVKLGNSWCASHTGTYCIRRLENTDDYNQTLVSCSGGVATLSKGVCVEHPGVALDYLKPASNTYTPRPANSGHYCNVVDTDGTWGFDWTGNTPCATLLAQKPNATIVRAGIYSTTGVNSIQFKCNNGGWVDEGTGTQALIDANNAVGHTNNKCVVTVSPKSMRVFNAPFPTNTWAASPAAGGRGYKTGHTFDHGIPCQANDANCPCGASGASGKDCFFDLSNYGGADVVSSSFDNRAEVTGAGDNSYDYEMAEGTPMRALGWGKVLASRDRPIAWMNLGIGTPYQGEIYIQFDIGSATSPYRESFVGYYAHLRRRVAIEPGQIVAPGQIIGYSGTSGTSSDPHLHFAVTRITNINGTLDWTPSGLSFGHQVAYFANVNHEWGVQPSTVTGLVDPYGWRAPLGIDPYGYYWSRAKAWDNVVGAGAWGPALYKAGEIPPYPG